MFLRNTLSFFEGRVRLCHIEYTTDRTATQTSILKPRAKEADHSNGRRPTLARFRLPAIRNDVVRRMPRYLWRAR